MSQENARERERYLETIAKLTAERDALRAAVMAHYEAARAKEVYPWPWDQKLWEASAAIAEARTK